MTPDQLKSIRKTAGLTQPEAANLVGVTVRTFQRWESGTSRIQPAAAKILFLLSSQKTQ